MKNMHAIMLWDGFGGLVAGLFLGLFVLFFAILTVQTVFNIK